MSPSKEMNSGDIAIMLCSNERNDIRSPSKELYKRTIKARVPVYRVDQSVQVVLSKAGER